MGADLVRAVLGAGLVLLAVTSGAATVVTVSLRQALVPPELLGRVTSSYRLLGMSAVPVGAGPAGVVARGSGVQAPYLLAGVLLLAAAAATAPVLPRASWPVGSVTPEPVHGT